MHPSDAPAASSEPEAGSEADQATSPGGAGTAPPAVGSRRAAVIGAGAAIVAVIAVALAGHHVAATVAHAQVWPEWSAADARYDESTERYDAAADRGSASAERAERLLEVPTGDLVADEDRTALEAAVAAAREIAADEPAGAGGIASLTDPADVAPAWERYADLWELIELIPDRHEAAAAAEASTERVAAATRAVSDATDALLDGAKESAAAALDASPHATYRARAALERALDDTWYESGSVARLPELVTAVADVRTSHSAEAERRGAHPVRAEIEDFARSISYGVEIDFAWAYVVGGYSSDGWFSGTAEFFDDGDGWGLVSLSESIENAWSWDENAKAVVVHEVGHTQVLREECHAIFAGPEFGGDHEAWATAWAIGMGYDLPGSGIEAYGRPSDAQIAAAAECR
ncbi:hypothetical protein [Agromyces sp. ZXT2-6]|uniref:hypothetical protein n=1 Tax=Agromyces sp. ZXT2-6 TaxID=3461153 RepID=UPI00405531D8